MRDPGNRRTAARDIGALSGIQKFRERLGAGDRKDFYRFSIASSGRVNISLKGLRANADLALLDESGKTLFRSRRKGTQAEKITANLEVGNYYIKVFRRSGETAYKLRLKGLSPTEFAGDGINGEEQALYDLINQHRAANGLPAIPLSKALSTVANRHVIDLDQHYEFATGNSLHSWSDAPYDATNPDTYPTIWEAPQRLQTGYPGNGYENAFGGSGDYVATAADAFNGWKNSSSHNAVILNQGGWSNLTWNALGIGIRAGFAVIWFGEVVDPTGPPTFE
ncbi:MAG: pre-peptidase C-terminal domain-containing protein [Synechococcales bacterium]|nr:pre-peptidase C-terminal domain-containing protein [Synechococcales bacterium]